MKKIFKIHESKKKWLLELIYYFIKNIPFGVLEYVILTFLLKLCAAIVFEGYKLFIYIYVIVSFICVFCISMIYAKNYDSTKVQTLMEKYESIGKEYRNEIQDVYIPRILDLEHELYKEKVDFEPWDFNNSFSARIGNKTTTYSSFYGCLGNYLYNGQSIIILSFIVPALHYELMKYPIYCIAGLTVIFAILDNTLHHGYISYKELEDAIKHDEVPEIKELNEVKKHYAELLRLIPNNKECFKRFSNENVEESV